MPIPPILRLDSHGQPVSWIPWQEAVSIVARRRVAWTAGEHDFQLRGGLCRLTGERSIIRINSIIAVRGESRRRHRHATPPLTNRELFRRDKHTCLYCGREMQDNLLTRDHIRPISRGGRDHWRNVVTACKRCNTRKGNKTPEEAHMPLLAIPYVPNLAEYLALRNRRILGDQMEFLRMQFGNADRGWHKQ